MRIPDDLIEAFYKWWFIISAIIALLTLIFY